MILWILIFVLALAALLKSSKLFVDSCEKVAKTLGWSSFFVGVTLLAIGTSLPELASSLWATQNGYTSIVAANVVGSNIANILLILGLGAVLTKRIELSKDTLHSQMGLLLGTTFLLLVTLYDGSLNWYEGVLLVLAYVIYGVYNAEEHKAGRLEWLKNWFKREPMEGKHIGILIASGAVLVTSSYFVMKSLETISSQAHIMPSVLGASLLAIGTSLPELITTIIAFQKRDTDLAMGGIIGSNIFNATLVMGLPALFRPLDVANEVLVLGIPFLLMSTLLLIFALSQRKLFAYEGSLYLMLFVIFLFQLLTSF